MKSLRPLQRAMRWLNLPTVSLLALLQRTPVVRVVIQAEEFVLASPVGVVLKSAFAAAASLGAVHSLAGATQLSTTSPSPFAATVGTAATIGFSITGTTSDPETWTVSGTLPPGMTFQGGATGGVIAAATLTLSGTPTTAGNYSLTLRATDTPTGLSTANFTYDINVTGGTSNTAPAITTQPQTQTVNVGANVTFTVAASGTPAPTFQWRKDGTNLAGETGTTLTLNSVQTTAAGVYSVVATNSAGTATSSNATLTVNAATTTAPAITTQPLSQTVNVGANVTFTVAASGTPAPTYQWRKDGTAIAGETGTTLTLNNVQTTTAGVYSVVATNSAGTATSSNATLTVNTPGAGAPNTPASAGAFASSPTEVTVSWQPPASGVAATGYKLERATNSAFSAGLTTFDLPASTTYVDTTASANTTFFYRVSAVNGTSASSPTATMQVQTPGGVGSGRGKFAGIATRAFCSTGDRVPIGGFVIAGSTPKRVLVRAVGPTLDTQGVSAAELLMDPVISLHQGAPSIAQNDNWGDNANAAEIVTVSAQLGVAPLRTGDTTSAALLVTLSPGVYTFVVSGKDGSSGIVLLELYDADEPGADSRFAGIATRAYSGGGNRVPIGGFVIAGGAPKQVLLRAIGPTLTTQGISQADAMGNPNMALHSGQPLIAANDNWNQNANAAAITTEGLRIGVNPPAGFDASSAAMLFKMPSGVYTFIARGQDDSPGIVLIEIYDAD